MKRIALFCTLSLIAFQSLSAQTLDEFVEHAQANNPEIAALIAQTKAAKEDATLVGSLENPQLSLQVTNIDFTDPTRRDIEPMQQVMVGLSQKLPITNKLTKQKTAALHAVGSLEERIAQKKLDIEFDIKKTAYELAKAREVRKNDEFYLKTIIYASKLDAVTAATGGSSYARLVKSQMEIARTKRQIIELKQTEESLYAALESYGIAINSPIETTFEIPKISVDSITIDRSPTAKSLQKSSAMAQSELDAASLEKVPDIGLTLGYAGADSSFRNYWFFGVSVSLPVYGREEATIRKRLSEMTSRNRELDDVKNKLTAQLISAKAQYKSALESYVITKKIIHPLSSHLVSSSLATVKTAESTSDDAVEAMKERLLIQNDLAEYTMQALIALAQIKQISGQTP